MKNCFYKLGNTSPTFHPFQERVISLNLEEEQEADHESVDTVKDKKKHSNPLVRMVLGIFQKKEPEIRSKEAVLEMLQPSRYKPNDLEEMAKDTKYSKDEVKFLYRAFKQECPNGIIDKETFKDVYGKIFPLGDSTKYSQRVFDSIDRDKTGGITFGDFMEFLSVLTKGSVNEKLQWSFQFYDINQDGMIDRSEMLQVSTLLRLVTKG